MKFFKNNKNTKKQLRLLLCNFARRAGVARVVFNSNAKRVNGTYNSGTNILYISNKQTKKQMLITLFHELGHHWAVQKNKWKKYHFGSNKTISYSEAFDIENKIDQIGEKLWNNYVDIKQWGRYKYSYLKKEKSFIIKNFISKL